MLVILIVALATLLSYVFWLVTRRRDAAVGVRVVQPAGAGGGPAPEPPDMAVDDAPPAPFGAMHEGRPSSVEDVLSGIELPPELSLLTHLADGERRSVDADGRTKRVVFLTTAGGWDAASRALGEAISRTGTTVEWVTPTEAVLVRRGARAVMVVHPDAAGAMLGANKRMFPTAPPASVAIEVRST